MKTGAEAEDNEECCSLSCSPHFVHPTGTLHVDVDRDGTITNGVGQHQSSVKKMSYQFAYRHSVGGMFSTEAPHPRLLYCKLMNTK